MPSWYCFPALCQNNNGMGESGSYGVFKNAQILGEGVAQRGRFQQAHYKILQVKPLNRPWTMPSPKKRQSSNHQFVLAMIWRYHNFRSTVVDPGALHLLHRRVCSPATRHQSEEEGPSARTCRGVGWPNSPRLHRASEWEGNYIDEGSDRTQGGGEREAGLEAEARVKTCSLFSSLDGLETKICKVKFASGINCM